MRKLKTVRYFLEYLVVLAAAVGVRALSLEATHKLGRFLGRLAWMLGVTRKLTRRNLAAAFPEKTPAERDAIGVGCLQHASITFLELMRMPLIDPRDLEKDVEFLGEEILERSLARGKGAVCLSAHFGNWEMMGAALVERGYPLAFLIGQQSNPWVDRLFNSYRLHCNIQLIPLKDVRQVITTLKRNQMIALLGDQDGDKYGMFQPMFGRAASTFTGAAVFCRKTGADLIFGVPVRLGPRRHRVIVQRLPEPPEGLSDREQDAFRLRAYNQALEAVIRQHPEQWWWMHNRWEARPEHRLGGEPRRRAERGEITFDMDRQAWVEAATGRPLDPDELSA